MTMTELWIAMAAIVGQLPVGDVFTLFGIIAALFITPVSLVIAYHRKKTSEYKQSQSQLDSQLETLNQKNNNLMIKNQSLETQCHNITAAQTELEKSNRQLSAEIAQQKESLAKISTTAIEFHDIFLLERECITRLTRLAVDNDIDAATIYASQDNIIFPLIFYPSTSIDVLRKKFFSIRSNTQVGAAFVYNSDKLIEKQDFPPRISQDFTKAAVPLRQHCFMATKILENDHKKFVFQYLSANQTLKTRKPDTEELMQAVCRFVSHKNFLHLYPHLDKKLNTELAALFFDLSCSSQLINTFEHLATIHINSFIVKMCNIALAQYGEIHKYTGDGAFIIFKAADRTTIVRHIIQCALQMANAMKVQRTEWTEEHGFHDDLISKLHLRIGCSVGEVRSFEIGHPDFLDKTYIGKPIHTAYHLCEGSKRAEKPTDRILVDADIKQCALVNKIPGIRFEDYSRNGFSKSTDFSDIFLLSEADLD
jgi:class 3 adenylate cyclase/regulator of replication initiation timing